MNNSLSTGAGFLFQGFSLIRRPKLRRFVIIPLLFNIILFSIMMFVAAHYFGQLNHWIMSMLPSWLQWLSWILWIFFAFGLLFIAGFTFTAVATIIAAPFNSILSEQVEYYLTNNLPDSARASVLDSVKDIPRIFKRQCQIIGYFIPRALILLVLFVIPVISVIASPCWFIFSAWSLSLQYLDYPMDNHRIAFPNMRQHMSDCRFTTLGFGLSVLVLTLIPIVNFFVMPAAVAGATAMFNALSIIPIANDKQEQITSDHIE